MIRRPPRSTRPFSSAASDVYKRQREYWMSLCCGFSKQSERALPKFPFCWTWTWTWMFPTVEVIRPFRRSRASRCCICVVWGSFSRYWGMLDRFFPWASMPLGSSWRWVLVVTTASGRLFQTRPVLSAKNFDHRLDGSFEDLGLALLLTCVSCMYLITSWNWDSAKC